MLFRSYACILLLISAIFRIIQGTPTPKDVQEITTISEDVPTESQDVTTVSQVVPTESHDASSTSTGNTLTEHTEPFPSNVNPIDNHAAEPDTPKDKKDEPSTTESEPTSDASFLRWFDGTEWSSPECQAAVKVRYGRPELEDLKCGSVHMFIQFSDTYKCNRNEKCQMLMHFCKNSTDGYKEFIRAELDRLCK